MSKAQAIAQILEALGYGAPTAVTVAVNRGEKLQKTFPSRTVLPHNYERRALYEGDIEVYLQRHERPRPTEIAQESSSRATKRAWA